jgi:hypothetical protein
MQHKHKHKHTPGGPGRLRSWSGPVETDFQGQPRFSYANMPGEGAEGPGRGERAPIASGGGMRRSEEAKVSEEAVRRKGSGGGPRELGMG